MAIVRARVPLRVSFAGGGTDVNPYPELAGGLVLCTTIDKYVYGSLVPRDDGQISLRSLDYGVVAHYRTVEDLRCDGHLALVESALRRLGAKGGFDLFIHSDAPLAQGSDRHLRLSSLWWASSRSGCGCRSLTMRSPRRPARWSGWTLASRAAFRTSTPAPSAVST